jgi:hypothetical protein
MDQMSLSAVLYAGLLPLTQAGNLILATPSTQIVFRDPHDSSELTIARSADALQMSGNLDVAGTITGTLASALPVPGYGNVHKLASPCDDGGFETSGFTVEGAHAFVSCFGDGIHKCDYSAGAISNCAKMASAVASPCPSHTISFTVEGAHAFFSCNAGGIYQCDYLAGAFSNCALTSMTPSSPVCQYAEGFAVEGTHAFFSCSDAVYKCDYPPALGGAFSNCAQIRQASPECGATESLTVVGAHAYLSCHTMGLLKCDYSAGVISNCAELTDPRSPCIITYEFTVVGAQAFFSCVADGLYGINVPPPPLPAFTWN